MRLYNRLEQRLTLPGDSETHRSQKTVLVILMIVGGLLSLINIFTDFSVGMTATGTLYVLWMVFVLSAALLIIVFPRLWTFIATLAIILVMIVSLFIHLASGGFQSGLETAIWMLQGPIGAALFFNPRFTIISLLFYVILVITAAFLEPWAFATAPQIPFNVRMQIATSNLIFFGAMATAASLYLLRQVEHYRREADDLLHNMLPEAITARLKRSSRTIADEYDNVTILFADIVGSTPLFANLEPAAAVAWLNEVFTLFDCLVAEHGLEKIRTIGDGYMVAAGVPLPRSDHAQAMTRFALDLQRRIKDIPARNGQQMGIRVGLNSGPVVAGVIGTSKYQYDLWGDAVNIASRMESTGEVGKVHISQNTYELIKDEFDCTSRGKIPIKGKGEMAAWFVTSLRGKAPE